MKYRVKLKTTVTAWAEVEIAGPAATDTDMREWAADDAVDLHAWVLTEPLDRAAEELAMNGDNRQLEHGPIELAHEELDENVQAVP